MSESSKYSALLCIMGPCISTARSSEFEYIATIHENFDYDGIDKTKLIIEWADNLVMSKVNHKKFSQAQLMVCMVAGSVVTKTVALCYYPSGQKLMRVHRPDVEGPVEIGTITRQRPVWKDSTEEED